MLKIFTSILKLVLDDEIAQEYNSTNTTEIELKDISNGTQKLILGYVRSGVYSSSYTAAIGRYTNNYSRDDNYIEFSGTYVDSDGNETEFVKQVYFTVDWYGTTDSTIAALESGSTSTKYSTSNLDSLVSDGILTLTFSVFTSPKSTKKLITYGSYIYGTIPDFNGYSATSCTISGTNITYTYDEDTRRIYSTT